MDDFYTDEHGLELRSEEVQEILGKTPHWLMRFGILGGLIVLISMAYYSYWAVYPETISTQVRISSEDPMRRLFSPKSQLIEKILVESSDSVEAGQTLIVFKSILTKYEDVHHLDDYLAAAEGKPDSVLLTLSVPGDLILGELDETLFQFLEKQDEVNELLTGRIANLSTTQRQSRIRQQQANINFAVGRKENLEEALITAKNRYNRENNLLASGLSDANKVWLKKEEVLQVERQLQLSESEIKNYRFEIRMLRRELEDNAQNTTSNTSEALDDLRNYFKALQREIDIWKKDHLIVSPIKGVVNLNRLSANQNVQEGQEIGQVLPASASGLLGLSNLEPKDAGQVREGQKVVVDFYNSPAQKYGAVIGVVAFKGKVVAENNTLPIEIRFPDGLVTNENHKLEFAQDMGGEMTIIVEEKRLIQWLLDRF